MSILPQYKIEDYQRWEGDWELIRGIPYAMSPPANRIHQEIARNTLKVLMDCLEASQCSCKVYYELDLILSEETVVRPDLMIICDEFEGEYPSEAPLLIAEIISPSSKTSDRITKFDLYQSYGVTYYLIIDPGIKAINVFALRSREYIEVPLDAPIQLKDCEIRLDFAGIFD